MFTEQNLWKVFRIFLFDVTVRYSLIESIKWVQCFEADFLSFLVEFYNDRQEIENLISLPKMHNCQSSKEIELLKPSFGLFLVDEYCIVNLMNAILGVLKVFS